MFSIRDIPRYTDANKKLTEEQKKLWVLTANNVSASGGSDANAIAAANKKIECTG